MIDLNQPVSFSLFSLWNSCCVGVLQNMKPEPGTNSLKLPLSNSWGLRRVVLNVNNESKKMNKNLRLLHSPFPPTITYSCIFPKYCFTRTCVNHSDGICSQREIQRYSGWNMQIKHTLLWVLSAAKCPVFLFHRNNPLPVDNFCLFTSV